MKPISLFTKTLGKFRLDVFQDEYNDFSPRENDNAGKMIFFHRDGYGDKHNMTVEQCKALTKRRDVVFLNVYAYQHGGITISTSPFSCPWDSGQLGIIYMTSKDYCENWLTTRLHRKTALKCLQAEVDEYNDYLTGNVHGFTVTDTETDDVVESCYGFIGDIKYAQGEGECALDCTVNHEANEAKKIANSMHL